MLLREEGEGTRGRGARREGDEGVSLVRVTPFRFKVGVHVSVRELMEVGVRAEDGRVGITLCRIEEGRLHKDTWHHSC